MNCMYRHNKGIAPGNHTSLVHNNSIYLEGKLEARAGDSARAVSLDDGPPMLLLFTALPQLAT